MSYYYFPLFFIARSQKAAPSRKLRLPSMARKREQPRRWAPQVGFVLPMVHRKPTDVLRSATNVTDEQNLPNLRCRWPLPIHTKNSHRQKTAWMFGMFLSGYCFSAVAYFGGYQHDGGVIIYAKGVPTDVATRQLRTAVCANPRYCPKTLCLNVRSACLLFMVMHAARRDTCW